MEMNYSSHIQIENRLKIFENLSIKRRSFFFDVIEIFQRKQHPPISTGVGTRRFSSDNGHMRHVNTYAMSSGLARCMQNTAVRFFHAKLSIDCFI